MLFYELRKILKRVSPCLVLLLLVAIAATTVTITALQFNHQPKPIAVAQNYQALVNRIENWDNNRQNDIATAFNGFYDNYKKLNRSATFQDSDLTANYNATYRSFNTFYQYYQTVIHPGDQNQINDYLLVRGNYIDQFDQIINRLRVYFDAQKENTEANRNQIIHGLTINQTFDNVILNQIFQNILAQKIEPEDLQLLRDFLVDYPAGDENYDYTNAYQYVRHQYYAALNRALRDEPSFTGNLADYNHFDDYAGKAETLRAIQTAEYALQHQNQTYAQPFTFGEIYNQTNAISLFDFLFTNLEMATIPLLVIVVILSASAFFTDTYQNTIITSIAATKRRAPIIISKTIAILILAVSAWLCLTGAYVACGLIFYHAVVSPDILCLFNGTNPLVISATNYFVIYALNGLFKMLPFIAICGLFSFAKTKPQVIVGSTFLMFMIVFLSNALLGSFEFYQYVPLLGLDPIRYFGAGLFISPTPPVYNILYTVPAIVMVDIYLYWQLIYSFRHHDFK